MFNREHNERRPSRAQAHLAARLLLVGLQEIASIVLKNPGDLEEHAVVTILRIFIVTVCMSSIPKSYRSVHALLEIDSNPSRS